MRIEIVEEHGSVFLRPDGEGLVIRVPAEWELALADCRLYRQGWDSSDCPQEVFPDDLSGRVIAVYDDADDAAGVLRYHGGAGYAGSRYLGLDIPQKGRDK